MSGDLKINRGVPSGKKTFSISENKLLEVIETVIDSVLDSIMGNDDFILTTKEKFNEMARAVMDKEINRRMGRL